MRHLQYLQQLSLLVSGGWDRSLRYWDTRSSAPVAAVALPERVYALHSAAQTLCVGLANRLVQVRLDCSR